MRVIREDEPVVAEELSEEVILLLIELHVDIPPYRLAFPNYDA